MLNLQTLLPPMRENEKKLNELKLILKYLMFQPRKL
jgi:hypothetical protein